MQITHLHFPPRRRGVSQNGRMESAARLEEERGEGEIPPRESGGFFPSFPIPLSHPNPSEMFPLSDAAPSENSYLF